MTLTLKQFASMGGKARAKKLTKKQLSEIGKKGGRPRLDKKRKQSPNPKPACRFSAA
jgi:general stress protein YciG